MSSSEDNEPFQYNIGGGPCPDSTAHGVIKEVHVVVIQAGYGDCTLLEVEHEDGKFHNVTLL